jgi:hypothetical protein
MLVCMRTTINLPDALAEQAKARAAEEGRTFTSLVAEGLRTVLEAPPRPREPLPPLPTWGSPDDRMLVDITDKDALWDLFDEEDGWR